MIDAEDAPVDQSKFEPEAEITDSPHPFDTLVNGALGTEFTVIDFTLLSEVPQELDALTVILPLVDPTSIEIEVVP